MTHVIVVIYLQMAMNEVLERFFRLIYEEQCTLHESSSDVEDIDIGVRSLVNQLLEILAEQRPALKTLKIIAGGSFYEQTKVRHPDEFDFMVVLDPTKFASSIKLIPGCSPWFKHIHIDGPKENDGQFPVYYDDVVRMPSSVEFNFWAYLRNIVDSDPIKVSTRFGTVTTTSVSKSKLYLSYIKSEYSFKEKSDRPQSVVSATQLEIGVDLMLAFEHPRPVDILNEIEYPLSFKKLLQDTGCHLVTKSCRRIVRDETNTTRTYKCSCWFISFSAIGAFSSKV